MDLAQEDVVSNLSATCQRLLGEGIRALFSKKVLCLKHLTLFALRKRTNFPRTFTGSMQSKGVSFSRSFIEEEAQQLQSSIELHPLVGVSHQKYFRNFLNCEHKSKIEQ